ncbi:MAG: nucleotidyltransferase domain-containing protein [Actinomycetota bacterium]
MRHLRALLAWERRLPEEVASFLAREIRARAPKVTAAFLFGSAARGEMKPDSDLDVAVICPSRNTAQVERALEALGETTVERFGNRVHAVIGTRPITELAQPGRRSYRLWRAIAKEGIDLFASLERQGEASDASG